MHQTKRDYLQCLIVISALTSALHVRKGVTFRLSLTVAGRKSIKIIPKVCLVFNFKVFG